jgi:hypothetical protein
VSLVNDTFLNNQASDQQGAGPAFYVGVNGTVRYANTVFVGNGGTCEGGTGGSTTISDGHNLADTNRVDCHLTGPGDQLVPTAISAGLGPLASHGGPTATALPLPGSPLIGAGDALPRARSARTRATARRPVRHRRGPDHLAIRDDRDSDVCHYKPGDAQRHRRPAWRAGCPVVFPMGSDQRVRQPDARRDACGVCLRRRLGRDHRSCARYPVPLPARGQRLRRDDVRRGRHGDDPPGDGPPGPIRATLAGLVRRRRYRPSLAQRPSRRGHVHHRLPADCARPVCRDAGNHDRLAHRATPRGDARPRSGR